MSSYQQCLYDESLCDTIRYSRPWNKATNTHLKPEFKKILQKFDKEWIKKTKGNTYNKKKRFRMRKKLTYSSKKKHKRKHLYSCLISFFVYKMLFFLRCWCIFTLKLWYCSKKQTLIMKLLTVNAVSVKHIHSNNCNKSNNNIWWVL